MKKITSIFMIFLLVISTIGPLPTIPVTAAPVEFPGKASYDVTVAPNNKGIVTVTMFDEGYSVTLHNHKDSVNPDAPVSKLPNYSINLETGFPDSVAPGKYYIKATKSGEEPLISSVITVRPEKLTNITSSEARTLTVAGVSGTSLKLYESINGTLYPITDYEIRQNGRTFTFTKLRASHNYVVTQISNGIESEPSDYTVTVIPDKVIIKAEGSGPTNNEGKIIVENTRKDNILILHKIGDPNTEERTAKTSTDTFPGLGAGEYYVIQSENGIKSEKSDNKTVLDEQIPIITLIPDVNTATYEIIGKPKDNEYTINKWLYVEKGYSINYKGKKYSGKEDEIFCDNRTMEDTKEKCETHLEMKITSNLNIKEVETINGVPNYYTAPGIYTITYTSRDINNPTLTHTVTREFTVYPNKLLLSKEDTDPDRHDDITGSIKVFGVFPEAKLSLFRRLADGTEEKLQVEPKNNIFDDLEVGNYFVLQEVNGVSSESVEIQINDATPPFLQLNGDSKITLEVGDRYVDAGATATDNITPSSDLKIITTGTVNTSIPGIYTIKYKVSDKATPLPNTAEITRTIIVLPRAVTAIGSTALNGEIGVRNIFPGTVDRKTTLTLYKYDKDIDGKEIIKAVLTKEISNKEISYVFKKYEPGRYFVTQTFNGQESRQSNVVEIVDIDRPYITLNGLETIELILGETLEPIYVDKKFTDPGATADDYLEAACLIPNDPKTCLELTATLTDGKGNTIGTPTKVLGKNITLNLVKLEIPDIYKIRYSAVANRGSKADEKYRIIKLAPPKVTNVSSGEPGKGEIIIKEDGLFSYKFTNTTLTLYNTYGQKIKTIEINNLKNDESDLIKTAVFDGIPAGLGYYVTQTVNGIESAPSKPVNVSLYSAEPLITSFEFSSLKAVGTIDHDKKTINILVPKGTNLTSLEPTIIGIGNISPLSGVAQNFTSDVKYTVTSGKSTKVYTVKVTEASVNTDRWEDAVLRNIDLSTSNSFTLTSLERYTAAQRGISFVSSELSIYVPASVVKESQNPTLSIERLKPSTLDSLNNPSWKTTISNLLQISWGNHSSFYQPIEVELTKEDNKVFVKLVRNTKNELMAIVQPSYPSDKKIVGLVSEPGTYALIEDVGKPHILNLENGRYQIYALKAGMEIYYTTDSKNITYEKPATSLTGNYVLNTTNLSLSEWKSYEEGETLTIPNNELYAVAVKNYIISPVEATQPTAYTTWGDGVKEERPDKIWVISFNDQVDRKTLYNNAIYVVDDATGEIVPTTLDLGTDGASIRVIPKTPYVKQKHYTLWVTRQIKGNANNSQFLDQTIKQSFIIK